MDFRDYVSKSIEADKRRLRNYIKISKSYPNTTLWRRPRKKEGYTEYYSYNSKTKQEKYLGTNSCKTIVALQRKQIAEMQVKVLRHNIACKERLCEKLLPDDIESIIDTLPRAYRLDERITEAYAKAAKAAKGKRAVPQSENPYRREDLTVQTSFGLFVRTRGELVIAEYLYSMGIEFYYEKALILTVTRQDEVGVEYETMKTYYPDFTIPLPDGTSVYIEHKGLMSVRKYVERDIQKEIDYNTNHIFQSHNLLVTGEGPKNALDMEGIHRSIDGWLLPLLAI